MTIATVVTPQRALTTSRDGLGRVLATVTLSVYGGWFSTIALMVLSYRATGSIAAPAGLVVVRLVARLVGALPGGVLADRRGAGRTVALSAMCQALVCTVVAASGAAGGLVLVYLATAVGQTAAGMAQSATGALVAQCVSAERRGQANGLVGAVMNSSLLVGPGLAGALVGVMPPTALLAVNAVAAVATAVVTTSLPRRALHVRDAASSATWLLGPRTVLRDPFLRSFALAWGAETVAVGAAQGVFIAAAVERFGSDAFVGLLYAAVGVGAVSGSSLAVRWRPRQIGAGAVLVPSLAAIASIAVFALVPGRPLAVVALIAAGLLSGVYQPWGMTELHRRVAPAIAGRVSAAVVTAQFAGTVAGATVVVVALLAASWHVVLVLACLLGGALIVALAPVCRGGRDGAGAAERAEVEIPAA